MEHHGEEYTPTYLTLYESLILVGFYSNVKISKAGGSSEGDRGVPGQILKSPTVSTGVAKPKQNERQSATILTLWLITFIPLQGPHKRTFFKCSFLYKTSPDAINTFDLQEVWFIITLIFMQWAGACTAPHCIHLGQ